jgi:hypothetical protein
VNPWYCLGVYEQDNCSPIAPCTRAWGLAARNMDTGRWVDDYLTGVGRSEGELCNKQLGGANIICQGDITQECSGYGVALYNYRTCRTYCPAFGDSQWCYNPFPNGINGQLYAESIGATLICDRQY